MQLGQRGVPVGLRINGIGLRLLDIAARNGVVLEQLLVQVGNAPRVPGGGHAFAVTADGGRKVR